MAFSPLTKRHGASTLAISFAEVKIAYICFQVLRVNPVLDFLLGLLDKLMGIQPALPFGCVGIKHILSSLLSSLYLAL